MKEMLTVRGMDKRFGSTVALNQVDFTACGGEIHGLIGENGSGKSTMTSIIAGMQKADCGEMTFEGKPWAPKSMIDALQHGVGMIVQETGTIPGVTVAENIFLGETSQFLKMGMLNKPAMFRAANEALNAIGETEIRGDMQTASLDLQQRKLVEVARIMQKKPRILVVDESTTALSQKGRDIIYRIVDEMKQEGKAVIFISHDMDEIMSVCDVLTVLRDGKIITHFTKENYDEDAIRTSMIGREMEGDYYRSDYDGSHLPEVALEAEDLYVPGQLEHISLQLHKGEIVGVGGLSHCGMHTLGKALFGAAQLESGNVKVSGNPIRNEREAMNHHLGYVAKDRDRESLSLGASINENIAIAGLDKFSVHGLLFPGKERAYAARQAQTLQIKCRHMEQPVSELSGGNKQKVVFGKWIACGSEILILDCPTRGVDIGVKQAMYQLITQMKRNGKTVLIISEELAELIGMSDRLLIMKDGQVMKEFPRSESLSENDVIQYMI